MKESTEMSQRETDPEPLHPKANEQYIFDSDFHLNVHVEDLLEAGYVDDPLVRDKLEKYGTPPSLGGTTGTSAEYAKEASGRADHVHGVAITPEEILEVNKETGADEVLLIPGNYFPVPHGPYPEVKKAIVQAYNDYLVERAIDVDRGIYGGLIVPDWDVELGLEELERHGDKDGVVTAFNWFPGWRPWGHECHDPLYDKMTELGLPLQLHFGGITNHPTSLLSESKRTYIEHVMVRIGEGVMATVLNLVLTGVFDKYPDLNVVINEAGTNWIPHVAYRADNWYQNSPEDICLVPRMREMDEQYLDRMPSEYIFDNMYTTTQPISLPEDPRLARGLLEASHADETFLFSTDWPHSAIDGPNWIFDNPEVDDEMKDRIFYENAEDVYRFPS